jgi:DNA-binding transcriptional ArsR family regulator
MAASGVSYAASTTRTIFQDRTAALLTPSARPNAHCRRSVALVLTLVYTLMSRHKTLTSSIEIAAYLHRTRMQMLATLRDGPATVTMIAERLGVHPANLTRHIRALEKAGLVTLVEKRDTGRNLEKWYASAAQTFDIAPDADALTAPHKTALAFARSHLSAALAHLPDDGAEAVQVLVVNARVAGKQVRVFAAELSRLAKRFEAHGDNERATQYRLVLALYPAPEDNPPDPQIGLTQATPRRRRQ